MVKLAWSNYSLATGLSDKDESVQVATLLTVIGEEPREVSSTFSGWENDGDDRKIVPVLGKFKKYCQPRRNVPFGRYRFNLRSQESGETYRTAFRKIAKNCDFTSITADEILRDRLVFGTRDSKTRERLLRASDLTLKMTDEICRSAESMLAQIKVVEDSGPNNAVNAVKQRKTKPASSGQGNRRGKEC